MAIVSTLSNHSKYQEMKKLIDYDADTFKIILMNTTFAFDKDDDATLADVTSDQLSTGNGYTQDDMVCPSGELTEDDTNDRSNMSWGTITWTASGGSIGPTGAAIVYDDTTADDTVIGCIDFGTDYTIPDGSSLEVRSTAKRTT